MTNREYFIHWKEAEHPTFVRVFKALPAGRLDYRPEPRSRAAADLVWLMVCEEQILSELIDAGQIEWKETPAPSSLEEMITAYEKHHAALASRLQNLDDDAWERNGKFLYGGQVVMDKPIRDLFWEFLFDAVHHRGQLSTYIRPMGGKVPSIYGPSADDPGGL